MSQNDKPLYSNSWDEPALVDNQDGVKTEFYEKDLNDEGLQVLGKLIRNLQQQESKRSQYENARTIVENVLALQETQVLLLEKLYTLNPGRKVIEAKADLEVVANVNQTKKES